MINVDIEKLKQVIVDFYNLMQMMIVYYDNDRNIVFRYPVRMNRFCNEIRKVPEYAELCRKCDNYGFDECDKTRSISIYKCHMNLTESISPIYENGFNIGYIMIGQIYTEQNKEKIMAKIPYIMDFDGGRNNLNEKTLMSGISELKIIESETIKSMARIFEMCASYLLLNNIIRIKTNPIAEKFVNYIEVNLSADLSVKAICHNLGISRSVLYLICKEFFKCSVGVYIMDKRMDRVKTILREQNLSVAEAAETTGFSDINYFYKQFKKHNGLTVTDYRKKYKK